MWRRAVFRPWISSAGVYGSNWRFKGEFDKDVGGILVTRFATTSPLVHGMVGGRKSELDTTSSGGGFMNSKDAMRAACVERGVKDVAESLGLSSSALYNQINDDSRGDVLERFAEFSNACGNDVAIEWACAELNGFFVRNPAVEVRRGDVDGSRSVPDALHEFGDVIREIGVALEDGKVTVEEEERIRLEWDRLKILLETFVLSCEMGFLDGKD